MLSITASGRKTVCVYCECDITLGASDVQVCDACTSELTRRRILAFLVDVTIWVVLNVIVSLALGAVQAPWLIGWVLVWLTFFCKDGFSGYSPGKYVFGLRVIDATTGHPADYIDSFRRNIPFFFPFLGLIMVFQLSKGIRWGDGWANTRVVRADPSEPGPTKPEWKK
jgi:uncharacterized RDD family membrane protein YckC